MTLGELQRVLSFEELAAFGISMDLEAPANDRLTDGDGLGDRPGLLEPERLESPPHSAW